MTERKMREDERLCKLSAWMANHNVMEVAKQCGVTRDALHKANRAGRIIYVYVNTRNKITYAFECIGKVGVFGFKSNLTRENRE